MARAHARLAARAGIEVHAKCVLLAALRAVQRDEIAVVALLHRQRVLLVLLRETFDRSEPLLLIEQIVNQRARLAGVTHC